MIDPSRSIHQPTIRIFERIVESGLAKTISSQQTGVAPPARPTGLIRIIAGMSVRKIDAQARTPLDNLGLGHLNQRCVNRESSSAFDTGLGR
jgi:hypothetical protein